LKLRGEIEESRIGELAKRFDIVLVFSPKG
jgi:hypothetical protein